MKKIKSFLCVAITIFFALSLCACENKGITDEGTSNSEDTTNKISFSQSIEEIQQFENKQVTISGYISLLSPLNGNLIYLLNLPLQTCPYCVPNTSTLSNTIAVKLTSQAPTDITTDPVKITGKLVFGSFVDDYGYNYGYEIEDATMEIIDENKISKEFKVYYTLSQDSAIYSLYDMISLCDSFVNYKEYSIETSDLKPIDFYDYQDILNTVNSYETPDDYKDFVDLWERVKTLSDKINVNIESENFDANLDFSDELNVLYNDFTTFINKYEL